MNFSALILEQMPVPAFVLDWRGQVTIWNKACAALTGVTANEVVGRSDHWRAFYTKQRPCLADLALHDDESGESEELNELETAKRGAMGDLYAENWCQLPNGRRAYLAIAANPIRDPSGRVVAVVETLRDLTAEREAEAAAARSKASLQEENGRLDTAVNNMTQGLLLYDASEALVICNRRYIDIYGMSAEIAKPGCHLRELIEHRKAIGSFEGDVDEFCRSVRHSVAQGKVTQRMLTTKDGRSIQIINRPLPDGGWLTTHEDVSERENLKRQLDAALNNMAQGWCLFDREQRLVMSNQPYAMLFGLDPQRIRPGMLLSEIINLRVEAGNSSAKMSDEQYRSWRSEIADAGMASDTVVELINGKIIEIHHRPMSDGGWVATHEDITDRRKFEARIAHLAHHDGLTGLANRVKFCETLQQALVRAQRQSSHVAVLYLDLDRFKEVNDTLGHAAGDAVLKATASRIQSCVRETDLVARLGGTNLQSSWSWFTPLQMPQLSLNALLKD